MIPIFRGSDISAVGGKQYHTILQPTLCEPPKVTWKVQSLTWAVAKAWYLVSKCKQNEQNEIQSTMWQYVYFFSIRHIDQNILVGDSLGPDSVVLGRVPVTNFMIVLYCTKNGSACVPMSPNVPKIRGPKSVMVYHGFQHSLENKIIWCNCMLRFTYPLPMCPCINQR